MQQQHFYRHRFILATVTALIVVLTLIAFQYLMHRGDDDIPLPFSGGKGFSLSGNLTKIGRRGADVYKVTFPTGSDSEKLTQDRIYLVYIPDEPGIAAVPFDQVLTLDADGSHNVDYFAYKYVTADAK